LNIEYYALVLMCLGRLIDVFYNVHFNKFILGIIVIIRPSMQIALLTNC